MQASLSRDFGVTARWIESRSRDTFQNAQYSAPLLRAQGVTRILLVTDALHEHRAAAEFAAAGLAVRPAPTGLWVALRAASRDATCRTSMRSSARRWHCMSCSATRRGGCLPRSACAASRAEAIAAGARARSPTHMQTEELTTVFRSPRKRACDERLLVLTAVGVPGFVVLGAGEFLLQVPVADAAYARATPAAVRGGESCPAAAAPAARPYPYAWVGCVVYVLVLFGVAAALSHGLVRLDAFDVGELDAARVQAGEWWRAWTALTLHLDGPHLAANLVAGVWFGYLAARADGRRHGVAPHRDGRRVSRTSSKGCSGPRTITPSGPPPRCSPRWARWRRFPGASASRPRSAGRAAGDR